MTGRIGHYLAPAGRSRFESAYEEGMLTLPAPAGMHDIDTDFGRVRAYRFGDAPGAPIPALAERHRVYSMTCSARRGAASKRRRSETPTIRRGSRQCSSGSRSRPPISWGFPSGGG
jgi:hypothetical protein